MKNKLRKISGIALALFAILNVIAYVHAYRFTHFNDTIIERTNEPAKLSTLEKMSILLTGIDNPRPSHKALPDSPFSTFQIPSNVKLECWSMQTTAARGTVILFHGYAGEKSSLIERGQMFRTMGFNTVLVDFMGSGGSEGSSTSVGYHEAEQVKDCYNAMVKRGDTHIVLFGTSMGAAAILKAVNDYKLEPAAIVMECPFGSLLRTVSARFHMMGLPAFPMASLLTFWGGLQHGYWAFGHNPSTYATAVKSPALLIFGQLDDRVSMEETQEIFGNMKGQKKLVTYSHMGHQVFSGNEMQWTKDVSSFLTFIKPDQ